MNLIKELRHAYKCDTLNDLAKILKVPPRTVYEWSANGVPEGRRGMLEEILKQKLKLNRVREDECRAV